MHRYEDQGRIRPIIHRASTVEIIVPYGDPRSPFNKKCAFDVVVSSALLLPMRLFSPGACSHTLIGVTSG